uniref:Uncharacterized protein n=1 Tax=Utricularia reniformis TaxID=192314 RepID=A0A1Y0B1C0_9LAMI|nr:hypothetical protein AEK19_MT0923 [Utricularia reniformis]ART31149.1 hypothetical protein AEK19_MT0923 [Utricularia reniformis]
MDLIPSSLGLGGRLCRLRLQLFIGCSIANGQRTEVEDSNL